MRSKLDLIITFIAGVLCGCLLTYGTLKYKNYRWRQRHIRPIILKKPKVDLPFVDFSITTPTPVQDYPEQNAEVK